MKARFKSKAGFSLAELVIAMTVASFVLTASYATVISLAKGSKSMINFSEMNNQTRYAIELFGRDARMAREVKVANDNTFTTLNSIWNESTKSYRDYEVTYQYFPSAGTFTRTVVDDATGAIVEDRILLYDVTDEEKIGDGLIFNYYPLIDQANPLSGSSALEKDAAGNYPRISIKHVQIEAKIQREVLKVTNTNYIISARFMLRNRNISS